MMNRGIAPRLWAGFVGITSLFSVSVAWEARATELQPSIFIRYQFDLSEVLDLLEQAQGAPLDPQSAAARWLDEMGWRRVLQAQGTAPFVLTDAFRAQLVAQDAFLKSSFSYEVGDAVWVPAEQGEQPYGFRQARVNPRGQIKEIIRGVRETYFVVEVGVDNAAQGGITTVPGTYYDGRPGPVLAYTPDFRIEKKSYVYSLSEIEKYNGAFRSRSVGSDTGTTVDYTNDAKWLAKLDAFKNRLIDRRFGVDFTASPAEVYSKQRKLILEIFNFFKMNRNQASRGPLLGDLASGGGVCFQQACVLAHAIHAVGEPYGIRAMNISGSTVNPAGGHGFVRITVRGPEEVHVFDVATDPSTGQQLYRGLEIRSGLIHFISDPGWADYGRTPDQFAAMAVEDAINPKPVDANRAIHELVQGKSFEEVVVAAGNKGAIRGSRGELRGELFSGSKSAEFLAPRGQIDEAAVLESQYGSRLAALVDEARALRAVPGLSSRALKSRILAELAGPRAASLRLPGSSLETTTILLTEYLFRSVR